MSTKTLGAQLFTECQQNSVECGNVASEGAVDGCSVLQRSNGALVPGDGDDVGLGGGGKQLNLARVDVGIRRERFERR